MDHDEPNEHAAVARAVGAACHLEGDFLLRSGQRSSFYMDKYQFSSDPELLQRIVGLLVPMLPTETEVLGGLELGGVPIATAIGLRTGLPVAFVRKEAKRYGTARLAEGPDVAGRRVTIIEDVVSTGGQVAMSTAELRDRGAVVHEVVTVIDRSRGDHAPLVEADIELRALFGIDDLLPG